MSSRLYLGNLPFTATEQDVRSFLEPHAVLNVDFVHDRETGKPRGFGFADLAADADVDKIVADKNGLELGGRSITVNRANDKPRHGRGGGGGGSARRDGRNGHQRRRRDDGHDGGWHG